MRNWHRIIKRLLDCLVMIVVLIICCVRCAPNTQQFVENDAVLTPREYHILQNSVYTHNEMLHKFLYLEASDTFLIDTAHTLSLYDGQSMKMVWQKTGIFWDVTPNPDETLIAVRSAGDTEIYSATTGQLEMQITESDEGPSGFQGGLKFSPDGSLLASGYSDSLINIWNLETLELEYALTPDPDTQYQDLACSLYGLLPAWQIDWSPDGKYLSSILCNYVLIWDIETQEVIHAENTEGWVIFTQFSPDNQILAVVSLNLEFIDVENGQVVSSVELPESKSRLSPVFTGGLTWSDNREQVLVSYGTGEWVIVDMHQGVVFERLELHSGTDDMHGSDGVFFSDDGKTVVVSSSTSIETITLDW